MKSNRILRAVLAAIGVAAIPSAAHAESRFVTGAASPLTASANLDFTITIPKFVYVRIGTGIRARLFPACSGTASVRR